ncbi:hypothetical protein [Neobacillus sp. YIM B06451]|uniref:hypothetical protein n=1 Tax=Neobacillus sp. YIM B06451 TaxID=3070994 RepID=UPI002930A27E|nr:hypothetical protein [Neobacillus sp. YIM B06451]
MAKKRKSLVRILVLSSVFTFSTAAVASAHYCYVANKPSGAGAVTEEDLKVTGNGKLVAPGAFFDLSSEGLKDVFIRGGDKSGEEFIVGGGSMHNSPATVKGSPKNGVQKYHFDE